MAGRVTVRTPSFNARGGWVAAGILVCALRGMSSEAAAQGKAPDFSSNQAGWVAVGNDFIPTPEGAKPVSFDPAHPYVPNNARKQATFRIADLTDPNLKPWAKERMRQANEAVLAGRIAFTPRSSCMPAGVPAFMLFIVEPIFLVQSPREVAIIYTGDAQVRHVYLDQPHSASSKPSWYGESVGRYDGDTLVIDSTGFNEKTFVDNYRTPHTGKLHVVERWKLVEEGRFLEVRFVVEDPDTFFQPWSGAQRYRRVRQTMTEQVCAENNAALFDYHIPVADRPDF
jgi:hypothetical protein